MKIFYYKLRIIAKLHMDKKWRKPVEGILSAITSNLNNISNNNKKLNILHISAQILIYIYTVIVQ